MKFPDQIIRKNELESYVGLKRSQIDELVKAGKFPRPVRLSARRLGWLASEIAEYQSKKIAARDAA